MSAFEPLRLGVIGLGNMGSSHLRKEQDVEEVRFVAVADSRPEVQARVSQEHGLKGYASAEDLIDGGECEAVLIATPHPFHCPIAEYAASRGLHVLSEKPIAVAVSEADRMVEACRRAGVLLGLMFQERTSGVYRTAREVLGSGLLGKLYRSSLVANAWSGRSATTTAGTGAAPGRAKAAGSS